MNAPIVSRKRELKWIPVEKVIKNVNNPREESAFKPGELESLRRSMHAHGTLQPILVTPYDEMFKLVDGERRWQSAKLEGLKEIPAIVVNRMSDHDELVTMFNVHTQQRPWEVAVQLRAIKQLMKTNGHLPDEDLAKELGVTLSTFRDRRDVLEMGEHVVISIERGEIEYSAARQARGLTKTVSKHRPDLIQKLGGDAVVQDKLVAKARHKKGRTREFEEARKDARDLASAPDAVIEHYIEDKDVSLSQARQHSETLKERRAVEDMAKRVAALERDLRTFKIDLDSAPNLGELRRALAHLADTATDLEVRVSDAMRKASASK
jgi:ParB/RepB/Spo0J family partition protein